MKSIVTVDQVIAAQTKAIEAIYAGYERSAANHGSKRQKEFLPYLRQACNESIANYTAIVPTLPPDVLAQVAASEPSGSILHEDAIKLQKSAK